MKKSKRAMRHAILCTLYTHLQEYYDIEWSRETFVDGQLSMHQIDAILAFKSDPRLNELRCALDRIDDGTFGTCIGCKREISHDTLDLDPARRVCSACEKEFSQSVLHNSELHVHV